MAIFYPPLADMLNFRDRPTEGEVRMLRFLAEYLAGRDDFEVFFQPMIEGRKPDIAILRKNHGLFLIEVKDYAMDACYRVIDKDKWLVDTVTGYYSTQSPITQLENYKKVFYDLYVPNYAMRVLENGKNVALVSWGVFLYAASPACVREVRHQCGLNEPSRENNYKYLWGSDDLNDAFFDAMFRRCYMAGRPSKYFSQDLYDSFRSLLYPPECVLLQKEIYNIRLTQNQRELAVSEAGARKKIRGAAGNGKTTTLAARAYAAYRRTGDVVLILTFNITLRNYIRDRLSACLPAEAKNRGKILRNNFIILHYHEFVNMYWNEYLVLSDRPEFDGNFDGAHWCIPKELPEHAKRYKSILIDEVQDYAKKWIHSIYNVLAPDGEITFWCDEKQNIYQRALQNEKGERGRRVYTGLVGGWSMLKGISFRMSSNILALANAFQRNMYEGIYEFEPLQVRKISRFPGEISYHYLPKFSLQEIARIYDDFMAAHRSEGIHVNDVIFLGDRLAELRWIDNMLRHEPYNRHTQTVFESEEDFVKIMKLKHPREMQMYRPGVFNPEIENAGAEQMQQYRRSKRFNFQMGQGCIKLSTIHCFKGWELRVVFLVLVSSERKLSVKDEEYGTERVELKNELVYTGMTRAKEYLVIINIGQKEYDKFFQRYIADQYSHDCSL